MPISTACFLSTTIILPQAYFKYNIFSRRESGKTARTSLIWQHSCYLLKFLSTPSAESVPVLLHDFTLCLSKSRLPCSLPIALPLLTQASHKDDRDMGSQTLIDDALPRKAEASNKDDLKTWFMCVWQFRHTHSYCGLARDRGRKSGYWWRIRKSLAQSKELVGKLKSERVEYGINAGLKLDGEIYLILFCACWNKNNFKCFQLTWKKINK